jgi:hypothetical protein
MTRIGFRSARFVAALAALPAPVTSAPPLPVNFDSFAFSEAAVSAS